jgi:hypothetical protein
MWGILVEVGDEYEGNGVQNEETELTKTNEEEMPGPGGAQEKDPW